MLRLPRMSAAVMVILVLMDMVISPVLELVRG
jgi:hypothetical protein